MQLEFIPSYSLSRWKHLHQWLFSTKPSSVLLRSASPRLLNNRTSGILQEFLFKTSNLSLHTAPGFFDLLHFSPLVCTQCKAKHSPPLPSRELRIHQTLLNNRLYKRIKMTCMTLSFRCDPSRPIRKKKINYLWRIN